MTLEDIRNEIRDIDYQILGLMKRRLELARLVGEDKIARNAAVRNIPQEDRVVDRYRGFALENGMNPVYAERVSRTLMRHIDRWFVTGLPGVRGASLEELRAAMKQAGVDETKIADFSSVDEALRAALEQSKHEEPGAVRIIAFGSFVTAAAAIESLRHDVREGAVVR